MTPVSNRHEERSLATEVTRDQMHHWRTIDLGIPCQVASPQSLTPLLQARGAYEELGDRSNDGQSPLLDTGVMPKKSLFVGQWRITIRDRLPAENTIVFEKTPMIPRQQLSILTASAACKSVFSIENIPRHDSRKRVVARRGFYC